MRVVDLITVIFRPAVAGRWWFELPVSPSELADVELSSCAIKGDSGFLTGHTKFIPEQAVCNNPSTSVFPVFCGVILLKTKQFMNLLRGPFPTAQLFSVPWAEGCSWGPGVVRCYSLHPPLTAASSRWNPPNSDWTLEMKHDVTSGTAGHQGKRYLRLEVSRWQNSKGNDQTFHWD